MNLTSVPRRVAELEYRAVRAPLAVLERRVVTRLPRQAALRLRFEHLLGALDGAAARILPDQRLPWRGEQWRGEQWRGERQPAEAEGAPGAPGDRTREPVVTAEQQLDEDQQRARADALAAVKQAAVRADAREQHASD